MFYIDNAVLKASSASLMVFQIYSLRKNIEEEISCTQYRIYFMNQANQKRIYFSMKVSLWIGTLHP